MTLRPNSPRVGTDKPALPRLGGTAPIASPKASLAQPSTAPLPPKPPAAKPQSAPRVGTGPLMNALNGAAADTGMDDLLSNALSAMAPKAANRGRAPARDPHPTLTKAVADDPAAKEALEAITNNGLLTYRQDRSLQTVQAMLEAAAKKGAVSVVREIVKDLADPARLEHPDKPDGHPGSALRELADTDHQAFTAAAFNLARNGYAVIPGGEKIFMTPGKPADFGQRLMDTGKLISEQMNAVEALTATRDVFYTPKSGWDVVKKSSDRRIEHDAKDVTQRWGIAYSGLDRRGQVAEADALAKLPESQQLAYRTVSNAMTGLPAGKLALRAMLLDGRLPGAAKDGRGADTLQALERLAKAPLHPELDRGLLVSEAVSEIHLPDAVAQNDRGTCAVAALQIKLAKENPAEFLRLVEGLASPDGNVKLANGEAIFREPGTEREDQSFRTGPSRLFQAAMMEFANGELDYSNEFGHPEYEKAYREREGLKPDAPIDRMDLHSNGSGGTTASGTVKAAVALAGGGDVRALGNGWAQTDAEYDRLTADTLTMINEGLARGLTVPVGLRWGGKDASGRVHGAHEVLVTKIDQGRVYYHNPWGQQESMAMPAFQARLMDAVVVDFSRVAAQP